MTTKLSTIRRIHLISPAVVVGLFSFSMVLASGTTLCSAKDDIILKSGRTLTGKIIAEEQDANSKKKYIVIRTATGGTYKLDQTKLVRKVYIQDEVDIEYQRRLAAMAETVEENWVMHEWCSAPKIKSRFKEQRRFHLENVIALDPDHAQARRKLGYDRLENGQWVLDEQFSISRGYQRKGTGWAPILQDEIDQNLEQANITRGAHAKAYSLWKRELKKAGRANNQLANGLADICSPSSVMMLAEDAQNHSDPGVRSMYVDAFATVNSRASIGILVWFAHRDPNRSIRDQAISALAQPQYDHASIVLRLSEGLTNSNNVYVNWAAEAIGEIASASKDDHSGDVVLMPLINAVVTRHKVSTSNLEPGRTKAQFNQGGGNDGSFNFGGGGPTAVDRDLPNESVVNALRRMTGTDFEFNEANWKDWYIENYTNYDVNLRGE